MTLGQTVVTHGKLPPVAEDSPPVAAPPKLPPVAEEPPRDAPPVARLPPVENLPPVANFPPVEKFPPVFATGVGVGDGQPLSIADVTIVVK